jgi:hypothetical protein
VSTINFTASDIPKALTNAAAEYAEVTLAFDIGLADDATVRWTATRVNLAEVRVWNLFSHETMK